MDTCAAPGNKTSHLASIMNNTGNIYALDKDKMRYKAMKKYMRDLNVTCVKCYNKDFLKVDPLMYGDVALKYIYLLEAQADNKPGGPLCMNYDRSKLLYSLKVTEECKENVSSARDEGFSCDDHLIVALHTEIVNTFWRLKVKLSATIPPQAPVESSLKVSSLSHKVKERTKKFEEWKEITAQITSSDVSVSSADELRDECGSDHLQYALLLTNLATVTNNLQLLEEAFHHLKSYTCYNYTMRSSSNSTSVPPPPVLIQQSSTSLSFKPAEFHSDRVVSYYSLFGRIAESSNAKVRSSDHHFNGLGMEVLAADDSILTVSGLQPNTMYVFAVAAYDDSGNMIGDSIGDSTKPILSSYNYSLPLCWSYLCQSAYKLGGFSIAGQATSLFWQKFIKPLNIEDTTGARLQPNDAECSSLSAKPEQFLYAVITTVFIQIHSIVKEQQLLPTSHSLSVNSESIRLSLVHKTMTILKISGWINNHSLCLQSVIMCYLLLVPLMQVNNKTIADFLLKCHCVLQELPDHTLVGHHQAISSIHHMIAAISYYIGKVWLSFGKKSFLSNLFNSTRSLLLITLPSTDHHQEQQVSLSATLHDSSMGSMESNGQASVMSYTTQSSMVWDKGNSNQLKKKKKKKTLALGNEIPIDIKSPQFKTIEGFFISVLGLPNNEDIDFNGQEDPVVLHAAISSLPIQSAYREVMKFKRRPQYLEYFVHLCDLVMKQGKIDLILSWSSDLFAWLAKRNEILLSVKGYTFKRQVTPPLQRSNQIKGDSRRSTATAKHSNTSRSSQKSIVSRPTSVKKTEMSLAVVRRRITRDDVRYKAVSTLHTLLPNFWRASKCKRRLRVACMEEHSWRSQINIIIASCTLKCIVDDLKAKLPANVWLSVDWYRLDVAGEFIDDAIPSYHPKSDDMKDGSFSAKNLKSLNQLFLCYQRAVVLAYRGSCWNLLVNACNGLWNSLAVLRYSIETSNPVGVAQLYGLSLRALYIASIHLLELCSINKTFSNLLTANLKQMVSLAVQVCYVNNHWEKTIYLSKMLIGNTGIYSMLYPVVVLSQEKLAKRVQQYSATPREPLEPSVHLDIQSHSFCDTIGISLGTTNVSFDLPPPSEHDKNDNDDMLGDALLALSRKLTARYLMKEFDCSESVTSCTGHAEHISDTYKKAIGTLMKEKKTKLTANGMHELGNVLYFIGEIRSASYWWRKGIKKLMKCKTFLSQWRSHLSSGIPASGYLMSAILASKIARYTLCHDIGTQFDYIHMSAFLFKNFLQHYTQQIRDIDFATYSISAESGILSAVCSDFFTLNSSLLISSLQFISHKMVFRGYSLQVLPILCLYEYFALTVARSIHHVILSRSYKVQVLSQLSLYSKAFKILQDLMNGVNLPLVSSYYNFSHSVSTNLQFQDNLPLNNSVNCKVLSVVIDNQHSSALRSLYSNISYAEFLLAKAATLTRLASTIEIIPHHKKSSSYPQRQQRKITPEMSLIDTKYTLLDVARVLVQEVMQLEQEICNKEFLPLKLRCHSMLSDIYCSFHCSEIATQISLLSLRAIQTSTAAETKDNMSLQILLEAQVALFKSLSLTKRSDVDADFPDPTDMIDKLEAYNDFELSCQLLYAYACSLYNIQSSSFDKIIDICKECITRLNKCDVLSQNGQRLKVDVTLLLSQILQTSDEVNCTNMRSIYEGLREMLKSQLKDCLGTTSSLHDNCYVPQLRLLAIVNLQIIRTQIQEASYMDHSDENIKEAYDIINSIATTTLSGKYLKSELAIILCQLKNHGLNTQSYLLDALSTTLMFDYIQIFKMYWLLADMLMQEQSLQLENTKSSSDITNVSCSNSPSSKRTPTQQKRELIKSQAKQKYFIWTSIKAASHCQLIIEKFKQLTSEFHNEEITKFIPIELMQKLPLFALMHFNKESISSSSSSLHESSIEEIHIKMSNCNISWFSLLEYFKHLLELSFVPESLCKTSNQLHCHHFTPSIVPKVQSLFAFIEKYCPNFKTLCCVPNFLPILRPQSSTSSPLNETDLMSPMSAKDGEVTILWCKDHTGNLKGFIALNDKHIKPSSVQPHSSTSGIYVYTFTTSSASALQLHHAWNDLANQCTTYVTSQITRPLSRSPSRMRQRTIEVAKQPIPFDLTKNIENAMVLLRNTLQVTHQVAVQVEPRTASSIAILLMPGGVSKTDKSDVYHFFKNLCFQHQKE
jgi:hypothetical protein